mgnify:CR=1 FL=1
MAKPTNRMAPYLLGRWSASRILAEWGCAGRSKNLRRTLEASRRGYLGRINYSSWVENDVSEWEQ